MQHRFNPSFNKIGESVPSYLIAGDFPIVTRNITIKKGQKLSYGSIVSRDSEGEYVFCEDKNQEPEGILTENVNANLEEKSGVIYLTGQFNVNCISVGDGYKEGEFLTFEIVDKLRKLGIYIESGVKAFSENK